jgi:hypothetical protein
MFVQLLLLLLLLSDPCNLSATSTKQLTAALTDLKYPPFKQGCITRAFADGGPRTAAYASHC